MARARRRDVFDPHVVGVYHCFNRIVRRSFLCGFDPHCKRDFSHRRDWMFQRLKYLANYFAVDVLAYAILSNHYHLVLRNRPDQVQAMSDRDVVVAWLMICPESQRHTDGTAEPPTEPEIQSELAKPERVAELRERLSNPSWLIRQLSQYMGIRCNAEDEVTGHFWESRFSMIRLLDDAAVLACLAYVDLNPLRANLATSLEAYPHVSIGERLRTLDGRAIDTSDWLAPIPLRSETDHAPVAVVNRLSCQEQREVARAESDQPLGCLPMELEQYAELLRWLAANKCDGSAQGQSAQGRSAELTGGGAKLLQQLGLEPRGFADLVHHFRRRFYTAAGSPEALRREAARRGKGRLNGPGRHALSRTSDRLVAS